jgi:lysophospholipase L1-like esterase
MDPTDPHHALGRRTAARRARRWAPVALLLGSLLFALALSEAMLWLFFPIPYREFLNYEADGRIVARPAPNQVVRNTEGHEIRINGLGFRGPDWSDQPAPGTLRVVAFGGSSTFNFFASGEENTWPSRLSYHLERALGMPVEVVNLGVPGYDATNSKVNYLFLGRSLNPHVVLLYHTWNDMKKFRRIDVGSEDVFAPPPRGSAAWKQWARKLQLARRVRNALRQQNRRYVETRFTELEASDDAANQPVGRASWRWFEQNVRDFAAFAKRDGVLPVLVTQATIAQPQNLADAAYRREFGLDLQGMTAPVLVRSWIQASEVIRRVAEEEGAVLVDGYDGVPPDYEHMEDHVHMTDRGRDVLAREIARGLLADERFETLTAEVRSNSGSRARGS